MDKRKTVLKVVLMSYHRNLTSKLRIVLPGKFVSLIYILIRI